MPLTTEDELTTASPTDSVVVERLGTTMAATRVSFTWLGVHKTLSPEQKARAADRFDAEAKFLSATKKLLDTRHPLFRAVTGVRSRVITLWRDLTLPYPDPGLRLIRQKDISEFDRMMRKQHELLAGAVSKLDASYSELRDAAQGRLGSLFNEADYPLSLRNEFSISWAYPAVEPPDYLQQLNPKLYAEQCQRVHARFNEAVQLAEQAFLEELSRLVEHLTERLSGTEDGKPKVFRDSAIENLTEFFTRFQRLNIHSNDQLDELVSQAHRAVQGISPQHLRDNSSVRTRTASKLSTVQALLDGMMVDRPRRSILRTKRPESA